MPTIVLRTCPGCGARLQIDVNTDSVKCEYCGAVSRIESKKPRTPPPATGAPERVIYVASGYRNAWVVSIAVTVAIIGFTSWIYVSNVNRVSGSSGTLPGSGSSTGQSFMENMQWVGHLRPMLVDVNQDGVMDVVGWVRFLSHSGGASYEHLAAFNALTGDRLWNTGPIAELSQSSYCRAAVSGDKLLVADPTGVLKAFSLSNGAPAWQAVVQERVERFCGGPSGQIVVQLKDKRALVVALATGQVASMGEVEDDGECPPLADDRAEAGPFFVTGGGTWDENGILNPELKGMRSEKVLLDTATRRTIALGYRDPGTRTPMAALYQFAGSDKKAAQALWMGGVSSVNPLSLSEGAPDHGAISQGRVIVSYELQDSKAGARLSCLDEATGRILWDVPIPRSDTGDVGGLNASMHHVFAAHWTYLDIFQLADGAHKVTIGKW